MNIMDPSRIFFTSIYCIRHGGASLAARRIYSWATTAGLVGGGGLQEFAQERGDGGFQGECRLVGSLPSADMGMLGRVEQTVPSFCGRFEVLVLSFLPVRLFEERAEGEV